MADYIKRVCRFFALMALVPLCVGFIGPWSEAMGILAIPAALIALTAGTIFWLRRGASLSRREGIRREGGLALGLAPVLLLMFFIAFLPLLAAGNFLGGFTRLTVNRDRYEAIVAQARKTPETAIFRKYRGVNYATDSGPPVRVLFNPEGARGFAGAIVYDPTGDVMLAKGWDDTSKNFIGPEGVTGLFTGGLIGCRHLSGNYYTCWFDF
ncbi:MAG: hypothetical protein WC729_05460 [Sphingomonas sp.]|uniref:hypothetical protein n=1 Tax=Sphingomonas sp. TaxID=28214 RepID=UPI003563AF9F